MSERLISYGAGFCRQLLVDTNYDESGFFGLCKSLHSSGGNSEVYPERLVTLKPHDYLSLGKG